MRMSVSTRTLLAGAAATLTLAACSDFTTSDESSLAIGPAFQTVPMGFSENSSSFDPIGDDGLPFSPTGLNGLSSFDGSNSGPGGGDSDSDSEGDSDGDSDENNGFGRGIRGLLMGGGLGPSFIGANPFGPGKGEGPFGFFRPDDDCAFVEATGRVDCPDKMRRGVTVSRSFAFKDAAGVAQPAFVKGVTNGVNLQVSVEGTKSRHDGQVTSTVDHESDFTVTGLAAGSTERTVNGIAEARETVTGVRNGFDFTVDRLVTDTTTNVAIPLRADRPTIPTSGTIVRRMEVSIAREGEEPKTKKRREAITFNGTNEISVVITQNGITKHCTVTVPRMKLVCE
jgi:hypothetical protein